LKLTTQLDRSLSDPSRWVRETDRTYGVTFAVPPSEPPFNPGFFVSQEENPLLPNDIWPRDTVRFFGAGLPLYPRHKVQGDVSIQDGYVAIYVDTNVSENDTHRARQKFEWFDGFRYTEPVCYSGIELADRSVRTFQNNLAYIFDFMFHIYRSGFSDTDCLASQITAQQERAFVNLFLSRVAFFRPAIPAADSRPPVSSRPQVVRFDQTPLVRDAANPNVFSTVVSWSARNADYVRVSCEKAAASVFVSICSGDDPELPDAYANRPPELSRKVTVSQFPRRADSIRITVIPFARGVGFPQASKSLVLEVPR
jgi:hypothetical protein